MLNTTPLVAPPTAEYLPAMEDQARDPHSDARVEAIKRIGSILRKRGINYEYPIECLMAKATLADLAAKDPNPTVRTEASAELGKVAQSGAVIRR